METAHWKLEVAGFLQGRAYPNVGVTLTSGAVQSYNETHQGLSGTATWHPVRALFLRGQVTGRNTDSLNPDFASNSLTLSGSAELRLSRRAWCSANVTTQSRDFSNRIAAADHDSYYQVGAGVGYAVTPQVSLTGRYAFADYTYPLGQTETTERVSLAATWQFGRKSRLISHHQRPTMSTGQTVGRRRSPVVLRVYAPEAQSVTVAGSFNRWQGTAHPLGKAGDGWWELKLQLEPGTYQYVYLVDGTTVVPADADRTVADGFGGQNGVLEIVR